MVRSRSKTLETIQRTCHRTCTFLFFRSSLFALRCTFFNSRSSRSFTLIELIVVLALMALSAGIILPRMGRSFEHRQLQEMVGRLVHTARTAHELAVARQQVCTLEINVPEKSYCVKLRLDNSQEARAVRMSWLKPVKWSDGIELIEFSVPDDTARMKKVERSDETQQIQQIQQIRFFPDGTSSGAAIRLRCGEEECSMMVHRYNSKVVSGTQDAMRLEKDQYDLGD